jgi:hypothetical protein
MFASIVNMPPWPESNVARTHPPTHSPCPRYESGSSTSTITSRPNRSSVPSYEPIGAWGGASGMPLCAPSPAAAAAANAARVNSTPPPRSAWSLPARGGASPTAPDGTLGPAAAADIDGDALSSGVAAAGETPPRPPAERDVVAMEPEPVWGCTAR